MADDDKKTFRVIVWGVPRSLSTCVLKCLSFQRNTQAWFEPYCLAFFADLFVKKMGFTLPRLAKDFDPTLFGTAIAAKVKGTPLEQKFKYKSEDIDFSLMIRDSVGKQLDSLPADKSHIVKDMAYGVTDFYDTLPGKESNFRHVFLIRHPACMFPSWRNLLMLQLKNMGHLHTADGKPIEADTFDMTADVPFMMPGYMYKCQYDLWKHVRENLDPNAVVVDCDELAKNPAGLLPKLCGASGMPYDESLLEWDGNADTVNDWRCLYPFATAEGQLKAQHHMAFSSTRFQTPKPLVAREDMTPDMIKCVDATLDYYNEMAACRIQADA